MKTIPLMTSSKRIIYFGMHLTKEVENVHFENYETLEKIKKSNYLEKYPCLCIVLLFGFF
jgi:hypothetical protein